MSDNAPDWAQDTAPTPDWTVSSNAPPDWAQDAQPAAPDNSLINNIGLTARYLGEAPKAIASGADIVGNALVNPIVKASNKYLGTNIPQSGGLAENVEEGLNAVGLPKPQGTVQNIIAAPSKFAAGVMSGGEGVVPLAKEAYANAIPLAQDAINTVSGPINTLKSGWSALKPEEIQDAANSLKGAAGDVYDRMRAIGATYTPDSIEELRSAVNNALAKADIIPQLSPVTQNAVQQINGAADTGNLSLNHLDQYRRLLRNASGEDSAAAGAVRKAIDDHVDATTGNDLNTGSPYAAALLNRARAEFTRSANFQDVGEMLQKANGDPTKIKNSLNNFLSDEDNTRGMTQDEIASLRRASQTSAPEAMAKMLGKAGFTIFPTNASGNGILPYIMAFGENAGKGAGAALIPHGAPLVAAGTVARAGQTLYGRGLAQNALDLIKNRELPELPSATDTPPLALEKPPIRSGTTKQITYSPEDTSTYNVPDELKQRQLPNYFHNPASRTLTYQPRPDFIATENGIVQAPRNLATEPFQLGEEANTPIEMGELQSIKKNPRYPPEQAKGGAIKKTKSGVVWAKPKSYPILEKQT